MVGNLDILAIAPEIALTAAVVVLLLVEVNFDPHPRVWGGIAGVGIVAATVLSVFQWVEWSGGSGELAFSGMITGDGFSAMAGMVVFPLAGLSLMSGWRLVTEMRRRGAEMVSLLLLAAAGAHLMAASANLIMLFIALEVFSISLYVLAGFTRSWADADEAALKYFLLGAFASAVFLNGVALLFAATGSLSIYGDPTIYEASARGIIRADAGIAAFLDSTIILEPGLLLAGIALLIVGLGFKVTAAPFHVWSPDVYQGAPGGITGFLAASAKVAGFAALARVLTVALGANIADWAPAVAVIAAVSIVLGTLLALAQTDIKRMLAYSSVAHAGFILTSLVAGPAGVSDMWFYVATYAVSVVAAFGVAAIVSGHTMGRSPLSSYEGLARRSPFLAAVLGITMLSMAGIPLTTGFVGKLAVFTAAADAGYLWLVILALVASVAGLYFYLRVIVLMYFRPTSDDAIAPRVDWSSGIALGVATLATVLIGVVPWWLLNLLNDALPF